MNAPAPPSPAIPRAHDIDPEAAAAVLGTAPVEAASPVAASSSAEGPAAEAPAGPVIDEETDEENIYEVMKAHMRRQKEEIEARNAQLRQQQRAAGRPGPHGRPAAPAESAPQQVEKAGDLSDLAGVWSAARRYLEANARSLNAILGHCCSLLSLSANPPEALLRVPGNQRGFTNERARLKLEEALRAVTGLGLKLGIEFTDDATPPGGSVGNLPPGTPAAPSQVVQRIPPEVIDAVKNQPVVRELMKKLDATVVNVELLNTEE